MASNTQISEDIIINKVIIVTGSNCGIGYETALELARQRGTQIILACRDQSRGDEAVEKIKTETKNDNIYLELLDLGDLQSIRDFAKRFTAKWDRLHILINNAGVFGDKRRTTKDGFESCFGINHLGHFLLTNLLLDLLKKSAPSRIINVSSMIHKYGSINWEDINSEKQFSITNAYAQSKLANILFTIELAKRLEGTNVTAVSLHPGPAFSNFYNNFATTVLGSIVKFGVKTFGVTSAQAAKTSIFCATDASIPQHPGAYYSNLKVENLQDKAKNPENALRLWVLSTKLVGLDN